MIRVCANAQCGKVLRPHRAQFCCIECEPVDDGIHCVICGGIKPRPNDQMYTCSWQCHNKRRVINGTRHPKATYDRVAELWATGMTTSAIGNAIGINRNAVSGIVSRMNLPRRGSPLGIWHGKRRLTDEQAAAIIQAKRIIGTKRLAKQYGVSRDTIWGIQAGKKPTYPHPQKDCK